MDCLKQKQLNKLMSGLLKISLYKILLMSILFCGCFYAYAEETFPCKVTGDRVNVRSRPDANSEIVTQLDRGEEVLVLEKGTEWSKIQAPIHSRCWVNNECIDKNVIKKDLTNVRCGPGVAFPVLVQLKKGTNLKTIEFFGDWTRIEPPVAFGVWVSSKYLDFEKTDINVIVQEQVELEKQDTQIAEQQEILDFANEQEVVSVAENEVARVDMISYAGRLEDLGKLLNRPGTYKLVSEKNKWICIIKSPELDINSYVNRFVRIEGVILSDSSSWGVPVIELKRLQVVK